MRDFQHTPDIAQVTMSGVFFGQNRTKILLCGLMIWLLAAPISRAEEQESVEERDLTIPISIGSQSEFYPYSFVDDKGVLNGFAIDLADAVAREMKLTVKWQSLANADPFNALHSGRVDAVALWAETKARRSFADFSVPVLRFETAIVVRKDTKDILSANDLKGRKVGVGHAGTVGELYVIERQPEAIRLYSATTEEQLRLLSEGGCDAVVMSRLTAVSVIDRFHLKNLKTLEGVRGYDVRYCMSVRKGDALLLARFNEGLAILHRTGEFDEIYQKWFSRYEKRELTPLQIFSYVVAALTLVCAGAMWGFFRQRTLLGRIEKQAAELTEQRSLLAALYDKHPLATVIFDVPARGAAKIVSLNQEAILLFGIKKSDCAGRALDELNLNKEMQSYLEEVITRYRVSGGAERWEVQLPLSRRLLEVATMPLGLQGDNNRICILSNDITKRRLMDQEIAKSRRLRALGELVGGIAHEFNNLLTPILATASLLRSSRQPAVVSNDELNIIDQAAMRAADLTKRLLAFGRKTDDPARTVRLSEAVANCEALLKTMIDRRIEWVNELPSDLPPVAFNPTDFNQIVFNLVLNARDTLLEKLSRHADPAWKPRMRISVKELPSGFRPPRPGVSLDGVTAWQKFTVEDNGMGIPHEIIDRIFEPFYTTKEVGKGTGLGLSMVWHQVMDSGGDLEVDSRLGEGTAFHVYLPRRESRAPVAAQKKPEAASTPLKAAAGRVLIVEDEPLIASTTAKILERLGHTVTKQGDGSKAWEDISAGVDRYDLLLVDLSMPQMNGIDLVRHVRTLPYKGRIVVMSGRISDGDLRTLKELRVDRLLSKPFTTEQLITNISELLAAGQT